MGTPAWQSFLGRISFDWWELLTGFFGENFHLIAGDSSQPSFFGESFHLIGGNSCPPFLGRISFDWWELLTAFFWCEFLFDWWELLAAVFLVSHLIGGTPHRLLWGEFHLICGNSSPPSFFGECFRLIGGDC